MSLSLLLLRRLIKRHSWSDSETHNFSYLSPTKYSLCASTNIFSLFTERMSCDIQDPICFLHSLAMTLNGMRDANETRKYVVYTISTERRTKRLSMTYWVSYQFVRVALNASRTPSAPPLRHRDDNTMIRYGLSIQFAFTLLCSLRHEYWIYYTYHLYKYRDRECNSHSFVFACRRWSPHEF